MYGIIPITPNEDRSKTVILLFRIYIIMLIVAIVTELGSAFSLDGDRFMHRPMTKAMVIGAGLMAVLKFILYVVIAVYFIMWLRRAYHNLHKAGSQHLRHSEGWAAGAWFVPFLNFVWPVQIVCDVWRETQNVFRRRDEPFEYQEDNITSAWWGLFITSGVVAYIGSLCLRFQNLEAGYIFTAFGNIGYIFSAFLLISMVRRISAMETEMIGRARDYYAWVTQQQAEHYQQQQQTINPVDYAPANHVPPPPFNGDNSSQDNFYQP